MGYQKPYSPIIKKKGFDPAPVAGRIPIYADGVTNPKVVGTSAYKEFWDEQIDRCLNGYITGGMDIPGRYYYFLNFQLLNGVKGQMYPMFVDLDYEIYKLQEYVKKNNKTGMIMPKARRKGLSEFGQTTLGYGLRFTKAYKGAIAAGLEKYQKELKRKFENAQSNMYSAFKLNVLENNEKTYRTGYEIKDPLVGFVEDGFGGHLSFETMYDKAEKLEGEYFHDVIFEESGQFPLLGETFESIKPALMFGSEMIGTFYIYGTGGNILSSSKGFKEFWDNAENFGLEKFWIPGTRKHYPFFGNNYTNKAVDEDTGEEYDPIPNLRKYKSHQIIGCEDIKASEEWILKKRKLYAKMSNKERLKKHNQSFPLTVEEAFTSGGSNNFNDEKIYSRLFDIEGEEGNYREIILDYVYEKDEEGVKRRKYPLEVEPRIAKANDPDGEKILVYQPPRKDILDLDVGGIDGYNQDQTKTGDSLGSMIVARQGNKVNLVDEGIHNAVYPVCLYYKRPARKEIFYDTCLKISIYYGLKKNTMCSAEQDFVIDYFVKNNGLKYLSPRPRSFDAPKTQQVHKYGAKMNTYSKPLILGVVQSWVEDYVEYCNFVLLLRDLLAYDEEFIGTDWDSVDALAYAIMRIEDMKTRPRKASDIDENKEPEWIFDNEGNALLKSSPKQANSKSKKINPEGEGGWTPGYNY
jgi:hypothetical protein